MRKKLLIVLLLGMVVLALSCAPGNERWSVDNRANFWAGLWHGLIIIVTFVVSWFTSEVGIYEANNVGFGYNIGFILGCMIALGGGVRSATRRKRKRKVVCKSPDMDRLGSRIESGVREGIKAAASAVQESGGYDWDELGRRIEQRVKEAMKDLDTDKD
ncbi:MAG: hypothetical protein JSU73_06545 [candidate division WOR-3 bacterium]|nr:MAG: hypothetical protein JSU73_06545 [candidate division WOR-3 bacterium]